MKISTQHNPRQAVLFLAMLSILLFMLPLAIATYTDSGSVAIKSTKGTQNMQVLMTKYEPFPAVPGDYIDVWLKIGNEESADITDFSFELTPIYPFSIDTNENALWHYGRIYANSIQVMHFKIRVDPKAVPGDNPLKFRYRYTDSDLKWEEGQVMIRVQEREAILSVQSVEVIPETFIPGKESTVKIRLKNLAQSAIRDIGIHLDLTMSTIAKNPSSTAPTSTVIDSYYNALPFVPVSSTSEKRVAKILPGEEAVLEYSLLTLPNAKTTTYKVPITIDYKDELDRNYTKFDVLGFTVEAQPDIMVLPDENTLYSKGSASVRFRVVNKGVGDLKFVTITLAKSYAFDIVSAETYYIGNVDSDDYEVADFKILVKKLDDNTATFPLELEFKDANGKIFLRQEEVKITAYSAAQRGDGNGWGAGTIILILALMVAGYFLYRRWEKRKKQATAKKQ